MGNHIKGTGNGHSTENLARQLGKKAVRTRVTFSPELIKENKVEFMTSDRLKLHGVPVRVSRYDAVFELYNPSVLPRFSEVLNQFDITMQARKIYSGHATVRNVLDTGISILCDVTLNEASWSDFAASVNAVGSGSLRGGYSKFLKEWQKFYKILPEYKIIVADMHSFLTDLRLWLEQIEVAPPSHQENHRSRLEQDVVNDLVTPILASLDELFAQFENVAKNLTEDLQPAHQNYMRRHLHPLVLNAPFAHRSFQKPLGYAGDYEMVNMIARNSLEGKSLFAKIVNAWFLSQPPSKAHRNRIDYLTQLLISESLRISASGQTVRVLDLACGPAREIQQFMTEHPISSKAKITLLDFNEETLEYLKFKLHGIKSTYYRATKLTFVIKSVFKIIKESAHTVTEEGKYDIILCAGLFDYLSDQVCQQLMNMMYEWLAPNGLLVVSNVDPINPLRHGMEHLLDWHLNYRTGPQLQRLKPLQASADDCVVRSDPTGVNVFLEVRKPYED